MIMTALSAFIYIEEKVLNYITGLFQGYLAVEHGAPSGYPTLC
jgi:hypothetical protein